MYLDDLKVLQDNMFALFGGLTEAVSGTGVPFLLFPCETVFDGDNARATVPEGKIVRWGVVYEFPETVIEGVYNDAEIFVCLKETEGAKRVFEDGQERACQMVYSAYVTKDVTGASVYWPLAELKTWAWYVRKLAIDGGLEEDVPVTFMSGYSGTVRISKIDVDGYSYLMKINIATDIDSYTWPPSAPEAWLFCFKNLDTLEYASLIKKGVSSDAFTWGGNGYYLEMSAAGCVVKTITGEQTGIPVIKSVNLSIKF